MQEVNQKVEKATTAVERSSGAALSTDAWKEVEHSQAAKPNVKVEEGHSLELTDPYASVHICGPDNASTVERGGTEANEISPLKKNPADGGSKDAADLKKNPEPLGEKLEKEHSTNEPKHDASKSELKSKSGGSKDLEPLEKAKKS